MFIDANHTRKYVERDTANGRRMLSNAGQSVLIWHDYDNPQCPDVSAYLDLLSHSMPLYHVEETLLVFHLRGPFVGERQVSPA